MDFWWGQPILQFSTFLKLITVNGNPINQTKSAWLFLQIFAYFCYLIQEKVIKFNKLLRESTTIQRISILLSSTPLCSTANCGLWVTFSVQMIFTQGCPSKHLFFSHPDDTLFLQIFSLYSSVYFKTPAQKNGYLWFFFNNFKVNLAVTHKDSLTWFP